MIIRIPYPIINKTPYSLYKGTWKSSTNWELQQNYVTASNEIKFTSVVQLANVPEISQTGMGIAC